MTNGQSPAGLRGEHMRDRVITGKEEALYLAATTREPLASVAVVLADTGMRPEESFRLRWESITWVNGRYGVLFVTRGKTAAARRPIPMTSRVRAVLESRWHAASKPAEGWVWPARHVAVTSSRRASGSSTKPRLPRRRLLRSSSTPSGALSSRGWLSQALIPGRWLALPAIARRRSLAATSTPRMMRSRTPSSAWVGTKLGTVKTSRKKLLDNCS